MRTREMSSPLDRKVDMKAARAVALTTNFGLKPSTFSLGKLSNIRREAKVQMPSGSSPASEKSFCTRVAHGRKVRGGDLLLTNGVSGVAAGVQRIEKRGVERGESASESQGSAVASLRNAGAERDKLRAALDEGEPGRCLKSFDRGGGECN